MLNITADAALSNGGKLIHLCSILDGSLAAREEAVTPESFHDADYQSWMKLRLALASFVE
jgi:hypothetical protein